VLGHSIRTMTGGTKHSAKSITPVPTVMLAPNAMPATTTSPTAANQTWITLDRLISFNIKVTSIYTVVRLVVEGQRLLRLPA
jgi:hypothetical protein